VVGAVVTGIALGVAIDIVRVGGLDAWLAARAPSSIPGYDVPPYDARGRLIDVEGRSVYLDCRGSGSPTVVLEAGFGSGAGSWGYILDGVAAVTRVCAWDRPGIGGSSPRGLHSAGETAVDLRTALKGAGEAGPFIVVAHSLGGVYARLFAAVGPPGAGATTERDKVLAFVMLDTYEPDLGMDSDPVLSPEVRAFIRQNLDATGAMLQEGEDIDWAATISQLEVLGPTRLPATLLMVEPKQHLTHSDPAVVTAMVEAWYRAIAARYPNGQLEIVPNTGHLIHLERPSLVLDRIRRVIADQRAR
jgi:pimeloyl-ACP methyl ester carboxylesterase